MTLATGHEMQVPGFGVQHAPELRPFPRAVVSVRDPRPRTDAFLTPRIWPCRQKPSRRSSQRDDLRDLTPESTGRRSIVGSGMCARASWRPAAVRRGSPRACWSGRRRHGERAAITRSESRRSIVRWHDVIVKGRLQADGCRTVGLPPAFGDLSRQRRVGCTEVGSSCSLDAADAHAFGRHLLRRACRRRCSRRARGSRPVRGLRAQRLARVRRRARRVAPERRLPRAGEFSG